MQKNFTKKGKADIGTIFVVVLVIIFIFGIADGIMIDRLGFSHSSSVLVLALITVGLLISVWRERNEYYEDMLRTSFDEKTVKTAKSLKEWKDEKSENRG